MSRRRVSIETDSDSGDMGLINPYTVIVLIQNACNVYTDGKYKMPIAFPRFLLDLFAIPPDLSL